VAAPFPPYPIRGVSVGIVSVSTTASEARRERAVTTPVRCRSCNVARRNREASFLPSSFRDPDTRRREEISQKTHRGSRTGPASPKAGRFPLDRETRTCPTCGEGFEQRPGRGRPRIFCPNCTPRNDADRENVTRSKNAVAVFPLWLSHSAQKILDCGMRGAFQSPMIT
jgi:hypothetical protein